MIDQIVASSNENVDLNLKKRANIIWLTGMSGSGKTTHACNLDQFFKKRNYTVKIIDGDEVRDIFKNYDSSDYSIAGRRRNAERICAVCKWLDSQNINVVCCILSIFEESRAWNRETYSKYFEVYIEAPYEFLREHRDYKQLYQDAEAGKMKDVVGVDIPFYPPERPDLVVENNGSLNEIPGMVDIILRESSIFEERNF